MWSEIIDQSHVVDVLRRSVAGGRVPHAYLFHGPDGTGKRAVALALARALECEKGGDTPCDACNACRKVRRMLHPDVRVLIPYPTDADEHEVAHRLERLAEEPYAAIDFARRPSLDDPTHGSRKQTLYTVGRVHEDLLRPMSFKPIEGRYKIAVVTDVALEGYVALLAVAVLVGAVLLLLQDRLPGWLRTFVAEPSSLIKTNKDFTSEFEEGDGEAEAAAGMVERDVDRPLEPSTFTAVAVGLYVVTSFLFGLLWMSPIFAVVYSRWFEQSWLTTAFLAALTFAMGWAFMSVLNLPLTEGALLSVPLVGGL